MKRPAFASFLRKLADAVESGDSAEGFVNYIISDADPADVDVDIRVRTGNLDGQGGYHIVNTMPVGSPDPAITPSTIASDDVRRWWHTLAQQYSGSVPAFVIALRASAEFRQQLAEYGGMLYSPTADEVTTARQIICDALNAGGQP